MPYQPVTIGEKLALFSEQWSPKIIAQMNDYHFKLAKIEGEFVWHAHEDTDEVFFVLQGEMTMHFRNEDVPLRAGELLVVPKGVEHKPAAESECHIMLVELAGTVNTGDSGGALTAPGDVWI